MIEKHYQLILVGRTRIGLFGLKKIFEKFKAMLAEIAQSQQFKFKKFLEKEVHRWKH